MDRFQLAVLASWAGENGLQGRKRIQKVAYFLKCAGCPIEADFTLHLYGPYSRDIAHTCDTMVAMRLLNETTKPNVAGKEFCYTLAPKTRELLADSKSRHPDRAAAIEPYKDLALTLLNADLWELELGSTILYFYKQCSDWPGAIRSACEFKNVPGSAAPNLRAAALARRVVEFNPEVSA